MGLLEAQPLNASITAPLHSVIGFVSSDVDAVIEKINTGNHNLLEREHTVLLGWNKQTVPLLKQIAFAQAERGYGEAGRLHSQAIRLEMTT